MLLRGLPLIPETALLLLPSIWGVRQGGQDGALEMRQTILLGFGRSNCNFARNLDRGLVANCSRVLERGCGMHSRVLWQARLASFAVVDWPVWYLVAMAILTHSGSEDG